MPQSLSVVYVHLFFSTKHRRPYLRDHKVRESGHAYLGEISKRLNCPPIRVGGVSDHVHILSRLGRTITQAEWVKQQGNDYAPFQWQCGYADFSVSHSNLDQVVYYFENQEEHHRRVAFQDELRTLLRKHNVAWDERYVWD